MPVAKMLEYFFATAGQIVLPQRLAEDGHNNDRIRPIGAGLLPVRKPNIVIGGG